MKKVIGILLVLARCIPLAACSSPGQIENVAISIENSEKFSMPEIQSAIEVVKEKFQKDFQNCVLIKIWYDPEESEPKEYTQAGGQEGSENVIVLHSEFYVAPHGADVSLNPDSTYPHWQWILVRENADSPWVLEDSGY